MNQKHEEILESIWVASESGSATIQTIQSRCPAEFSEEDLSRLEDQGHLAHNERELFLTQKGKHKARTLVRCHRLAESLLYTVFDLDWQRREALACQAEHTLVPELADGICTLLGHPTECPDGKPIPPGVCCVTQQQMIGRQVIPLSELELGCKARILFVKPKNHDRLNEITTIGLTPGVIVTLHQRSPTYCLKFDGTELAVDHRVAQDLFVCPVNGDHHAASIPTPHTHRRRQGLFRWLRSKQRVG